VFVYYSLSKFSFWTVVIVLVFFFDHTGVSFYPTTRITIISDRSAWYQGAKRSPLFQFTVSRGPRVLVYRVTVDIRCLFTIFTQNLI